VVQEFGSEGYWLPGGGMDPGELPVAAAVRECREEVGIDVEVTGLLKMEFTVQRGGMGSAPQMRQRFILLAQPLDESQACKTMPDFESAGSCWVSAEEVTSGRLRLRGYEPEKWFPYVANGGKVYDLEVMGSEWP